MGAGVTVKGWLLLLHLTDTRIASWVRDGSRLRRNARLGGGAALASSIASAVLRDAEVEAKQQAKMKKNINWSLLRRSVVVGAQLELFSKRPPGMI